MPRQNRVTPFAQIIASVGRGTFMGNRGNLHDGAQNLRRHYRGKRWIICRLHFKNRQRTIMRPGYYTELFFLDEATALAAGHRPCWECRRDAYIAFREAWVSGDFVRASGPKPSAEQLDTVLHEDRITPHGQKITYHAALNTLPDGAFISLDGAAYLVWETALYPWTPAGYEPPIKHRHQGNVEVLTPRATVAALQQGYKPVIHASASEKGQQNNVTQL